ncbi:MAG: SufD family Fe-S cluster assembly protein, partial [Muribaculaceae bacterium]|nr:SufD family Fe-S cluster assembly protein [Muribaculaceae bacterium]
MESNSLKQYLDFYDANRELIDANSAPALNAVRDQARRALEGARLPRKGDEGYERISLNDMLAPDFGINAGRVNIPVDVAASFRCDVPTLSTSLGVVVNDLFVPTRAVAEKLPDGVRFMSLRRAVEEMPDLIAPYLELPVDNAMVQLNQLLLQDGVLLHVAAGVQLQKPLQLVNILSASIDLMAVRRLLVIVEAGASAKLLVCDHTQGSDRKYMSLQVVQLHLGRDSQFDLYDLEEASPLTNRYSALYSTQEAGSRLTVNGSTLSGGMTRNEYSVELSGERSEATLAGFVVASDGQTTDNSSV